MISIKEYAEKHGITYEAVRKQVKRYAGDLEGHIIVANKTQMLDEEAERYLDEKRAGNPVAAYSTERADELERLKDNNMLLLAKIAELQDQIISNNKLLAEAQASKLMLEAKDSELKSKDVIINTLETASNESASKIKRLEENLAVEMSAKEEAEEKVQSVTDEYEKEKQLREEAEEKIKKLQSRGFWDRLLNKEV